MDKSKSENNKTEVQVCPLNAGIKINDSKVKDPNDGRIYKNDAWWGSILLGDSSAWEAWWDFD